MTLVNGDGERFRRAQVTQKCEIKEVQSYLYSQYRAYYNFDGVIVFEGFDRAGFTMDAVIDRLASGLIVAQEVEL